MIKLDVPFFPPSVNHAYFTKMARPKNNPKGPPVPIRVVTKEGKAYTREFKTWLAREHQEVLRFFSEPDGDYSILVVLYFKELYNAGWPKKAKTRHKKIDGSNYVKVLEDALVDACGHDDSQHVTVTVVKEQAAPGETP
jgi:Holliday junction resolvase RusA-like endonuclease